MVISQRFLTPSEAARRLGVSAKALRLYEAHGLINPIRTPAGWRNYGPSQMARATEIVALRALGLSLAQVARALEGEAGALEPALASHQTALEDRIRRLSETADRVRALRGDLLRGEALAIGDLARPVVPAREVDLAFDLPWPWGGERLELRALGSLNFIVGPLGSGKTRLARAIAENLVGATFVGMERLADQGAQARKWMDADPALKLRVEQTLTLLLDEGAELSPALVALVVVFESKKSESLVIDMVEQGLNHASQKAVIAHLRRRTAKRSPLFLMTRSSAILDLGAVARDEKIIFCPANHSPPTCVAPYPGTPGYEGVATCLAAPAVRARTDGVVAVRVAGSV